MAHSYNYHTWYPTTQVNQALGAPHRSSADPRSHQGFPRLHRGVAAAVEDLTRMDLLDRHGLGISPTAWPSCGDAWTLGGRVVAAGVWSMCDAIEYPTQLVMNWCSCQLMLISYDKLP